MTRSSRSARHRPAALDDANALSVRLRAARNGTCGSHDGGAGDLPGRPERALCESAASLRGTTPLPVHPSSGPAAFL